MAKCPMSNFVCKLSYWLWLTIPSILFVVGTFGNVLTIVVLSRKRLRQFSTTVYLLFLAVSDLTVLLTSLSVNMLERTFIPDARMSVFICKLVYWSGHAFCTYSVALVACMTIERALLTLFPVASKPKLTRMKALCVSSVALVFYMTFSGHYLFTMSVREFPGIQNATNETNVERVCTYSQEFDTFYTRVWGVLVLLVLSVLPISIIIIGNGLIIFKLIVQKRRLSRSHVSDNQNKRNLTMAKYKKTKSATRTLFLVSGVLLVTILPYTTTEVLTKASNDLGTQGWLRIWDDFVTLLLYCNYTFNFVLYFLSGTLFRQELRALMSEIGIKLNSFANKTSTTTDSQEKTTRRHVFTVTRN